MQKQKVINKVFGYAERKGILDRAELGFGSLQFVIDSYCELRLKGELEKYHLDGYSLAFFQQLRNLRMFGWPPESDHTNQDRIGHRLKEEILYSHRLSDECASQLVSDLQGSSKRAFYVIGTYDGINIPFLREWFKSGKKYVIDSLKRSGGEAHYLRNVNENLGKIGIGDSATIEPWDPARYVHGQPTLIVKGMADTVTAGQAAEYLFRSALSGPRTFIEFPGVGHSTDLPEIPSDKREILTGTVQLGTLSLLGGGVRQFPGSYEGRSPDKNFSLHIEVHDLEEGLELSGFGISAQSKSGSLDVVALIQNTGTQTVAAKKRKWRIGNSQSSVIVELDSPAIDAQHSVLAYGTSIAAWLNGTKRLQVKKPEDLETVLEPLCSQIRYIEDESIKGNFFELWLKNTDTQNPSDGAAKSWTVTSDNFSSTFNIDPEPIEPNQIVRIFFGVDRVFLSDLRLDRSQWITLNPGKKLVGCVQEEDEEKVSVFIYNPDDSDSNAGPQKLRIINSMFTRAYDIDQLERIPGRQGVVVQLKKPTYKWQTPTLSSQAEGESGFELLGWNVAAENDISLLIRNKGTNTLNASGGEWLYADPKEEALACMQSSGLRDCLIYSFLVRSPDALKEDKNNKVLSILKEAPVSALVCFRNGGENGFRKPADDRCP